MATVKISELESASSVTSSDVLPIVQNGITKKTTFGNIVESGSNTNGKYIKYGDGTMICYTEIEVYSIGPSNYDEETWTFPVVFYDNRYVCFSELCDSGSNWATLSTKLRNRNTNNVKFEVFNFSTTNTAGDSKWYVVAIGKWK